MMTSSLPLHNKESLTTMVTSDSATSETGSTVQRSEGKKGAVDNSNLFIRDSIIGFADGLTVPFALTAGLSSLGSSKIVVLGGLAELFAGSISMGLGAYLAGVTERKTWKVEEMRRGMKRAGGGGEEQEEEVLYVVFEEYGVGREKSKSVVEEMGSERRRRFVRDLEGRGERPQRRVALLEGGVMGMSYFFGGLLPMIPYFVFKEVTDALFTSIGVTAVILVVFGYVKALVTGTTQRDAGWSAVQTLFVGALAAGISYGIVRGVNGMGIV